MRSTPLDVTFIDDDDDTLRVQFPEELDLVPFSINTGHPEVWLTVQQARALAYKILDLTKPFRDPDLRVYDQEHDVPSLSEHLMTGEPR